MPHYSEDMEDLKRIRRTNVCAECGRQLYIYLDYKTKQTYIACPTAGHEGITREYRPQAVDYQSNIRRLVMAEQEHGTGTATELAKLPTSGALNQPEAMHILKLVYPDVPDSEIIRCAILCRDFGLHPLMKEVYIIGFNNKQGGKDYATVIGINASRKMAANAKGAFSFMDDTPRAATQEEIVKQFGQNSEEEKLNIISICKLQGEKGNTASGFGLYPKASTPYGMDKGNTKRNMANIRAERQAEARLPGGALPQVEVIDEAYVTVPDVGKVDKGTGEIVNGELVEPAEQAASSEPTEDAMADYGTCPIHDVALVAGKGNFPAYCPTRIDGTGRMKGKTVWCKGKAPVATAAQAADKLWETEEGAPPVEQSKSFIDEGWLKESLASLQHIKAWSESNLLSYMATTYQVEGESVLEAAAKLEKGAATHFEQRIQDALALL